MKINPSDRYLSLILNALNEVIVPDLQSPAARAMADIMRTTLADLLKREHGTRDILRQLVQDGEALATEIASALGLAPPTWQPLAEEEFNTLARRQEELTTELAQLSEQLYARPGPETSALLRRVAEWEYAYYRDIAALPLPELPRQATPGSPLSAESLEAYLNHVWPEHGGSLKVTSFKALSGGYGKQTYISEYTGADGKPGDVVVRKTDPAPILNHGSCVLEQEFSLLTTLADSGFPAPKPLHFAKNWQDVDGTFYIMDRIPGQPPGSLLGGVQGEVPEALFLHLAELLAQLHSVPIASFADHIRRFENPAILEGSVADCYRFAIEGFRGYMAREPHLASPFVTWLMDWLRNNIPPDNRPPVLIHGDFNIHNVLAVDGRVTAVLDWECAEFASSEQDLAYIKPHVSRHMDWQRFMDHYLACGGKPLNDAMMSFSVVYATLRMHLASNKATRDLHDGRNNDLRYAMSELGFVPYFMELALNSAN